MRLNTVTVQVAGKGYQLSGAQEPAHFHHLGQMVDRRIAENAHLNPDSNPEARAVAAALSFADELVSARAEAARLRAQLDALTSSAQQ